MERRKIFQNTSKKNENLEEKKSRLSYSGNIGSNPEPKTKKPGIPKHKRSKK
ncbi:hypothetical protein KQI36_14660 [Clostridium senegalense]|uniref:hypothetical protein n=1 Tax=Clostridium senegalense TaxID=1465809 RepID=UPI001C12109C|nr:hypothetical protein [Clostridium senegalense]MBU5227872.1 hypothetical protein [Clostridium senegalense]